MNWRPNILIDRSQCTCYKPGDEENKIYHVSKDDLPLVSTDYKSDIESLELYIDDLIQWDTSEDSFNAKDCAQKEFHLSFF